MVNSRNEFVRYRFTVTEADVNRFVDEVISRCYMAEEPQSVDVYFAEAPHLYEGIFEYALHCRSEPDFRFVLGFTQEFAILNRPLVEHGSWRFLLFRHPSNPIGKVLYDLLHSHFADGTEFVGDIYGDARSDSWIASALQEER